MTAPPLGLPFGLPCDLLHATTDVLVVGAGGAACRAALSAAQAGARVTLLAKAPLGVGGSSVHGASEVMGISAAAGFGDDDAPGTHYADTMRLAAGFVDPALVQALAEDAGPRVHDLAALGVPFDRAGNRYALLKSDHNTRGRTLTAQGRTGTEIVRALTTAMLAAGVQVHAPAMLLDLLRDADGRVCGALAWDLAQRCVVVHRARAVVLATGGIHGAFSSQVSTAEMTGDGQAIAFRHGAELVNLEFHQFGPAMLHPYVQLFSGTLFRLHPRITNTAGEDALAKHLPAGVAAEEVYAEKVFPFTTSNASRWLEVAMQREVQAGLGTPRGGLWFSFAHQSAATLRARTPNTHRWLAERGLDMGRDALEVGIAFQCMNGGVRMLDGTARASLPGLFVCGEVAGGVRGPDRPGGNSLAEGQVFGHRAGLAAAAAPAKGEPVTLAESLDRLAHSLAKPEEPALAEMAQALRAAMQRHCLVEKTATGLAETLALAEALDAAVAAAPGMRPETLPATLSRANLALCARLVLQACLHRDETRGAHNRVDCPGRDDARHRHSYVLQRQGEAATIAPLAY